MKKFRRPKRILIALWMGSISGREILSGIFSFAKSRTDWQTILLQLPNGFSPELIAQIQRDGVDGIIACDLTNPSLRHIVDETDAPLVTIGWKMDFTRASGGLCATVECDNYAVGVLGAKHFLAQGNFNSFGFLYADTRADENAADPSRHSANENLTDLRVAGFCDTVRHMGKPCLPFVSNRSPDAEIDHDKLHRYLRSLPKPAAIMCYYDPMAIQVLNCCRAHGMDVPRQVSVLGVDNDALLCESATPPLSSIQPDHERAGVLAAKELHALMTRRRPSRCIINCPVLKIVERESTSPLSPAAHLIARALEFIAANAARNISVADVVAHLGISRRLADLRFREIEHRTIRQAIEDRRLEIAVKKINGTNWPLTRIAAASGYASLQTFTAAFRRKFKVPPRQFRH